MNYYEFMGVKPDASEKEIKERYRELANKIHEDKGGDKHLMQLLNEAKDVLLNPVTRAEYNRKLKQEQTGQTQETKTHDDSRWNWEDINEPSPDVEQSFKEKQKFTGFQGLFWLIQQAQQLKREDKEFITKAAKTVVIGIAVLFLASYIIGYTIDKIFPKISIDSHFDYTINNYSDNVSINRYKGDDANVTIPAKIDGKSVTSIETNAFNNSNSKNITKIVIPESITFIGENAFSRCKKLKNVDIPSSVTTIEHSAFANCESLTSIKIPDSITTIGYSMFANCKGLKSVDIPNSVTSIENYAFSSCEKLKNITIPNSVISIGRNAFANCSSLKSIVIPNSVTMIGSGAFGNCNKLKTITVPNSVVIIGENAFGTNTNFITVICRQDSYVYEYCVENNIKTQLK